MTVTMEQLRAMDPTRWPTPTKLPIGQPIPQVTSVQATGKEGFFIIQWAPLNGVQGYRIAVMSDNNLANPNIGMFVAYGAATARYDYLVGNIALTRQFAVQAFREDEYGPFSTIVSATSRLTTDAGSAEPTNPASSPTSSPPPSGGGYGGGGGGEYGGGNRILQL